MGFRLRPLLIVAPLLLAPVAHAQQTPADPPVFSLPPDNAPPAPDPDRQGPELNVYRDPATPRATPPVVAPTLIAPSVTPPSVAPPQTDAPRPATPAPRAPPAGQDGPSSREPVRQPDRTDTADAPAPVAPTPAPSSSPAPAIRAPATPDPTESAPAQTPAAARDATPLPWIIGGAMALMALAAAALLRRRRPAAEAGTEQPVRAMPVVPAAPEPAAPPPAPTAPAINPPADSPTDPAIATGRPWLDMDLTVVQARYSLAGVTIAYSLILHNRGDEPAQDVLVRGLLGNGGAQQQALLQRFFAAQDGLPLHSAVTIAPGETQRLSGELRLAPDRIEPVEMGQRSLLIPIAAFDATYRWGPEEGDPVGQGRTARAFVVGQEQEPPAERLAPLRLDQGPRQYRRAAARAAAELTPA